jgi:hypothetical protein
MLSRKTSQRALDDARAAHTVTEAKIGDLHQQRQSALNDDADIDVLLSLDKQLVTESAKLVALQHKTETLSLRCDKEQAHRREAEYRTGVDRLEAALPSLEVASKEFSAAIKSFALSCEKLKAAQEAFRKSHPAGFLLPPFNLDRAKRALAAVVAADLDAVQIRDIASNFYEAEVADHKDHIATLRADAVRPEQEKAA